MPGAGPQSGLIIEVPAAEPLVSARRARLDASAPLGVPAHITILFPFLPPQAITAQDLTRLRELFSDVRAFAFRLDHTDWFGDDVLWLGPADPAPFRALTERVFRAYPAFPPFGGQFDEVVPHLTIGHGQPLGALRDAAEAVRPGLPIVAEATAVTLMTQQPAGEDWARAATFRLRS
jgi:2'-5' RNA ligase